MARRSAPRIQPRTAARNAGSIDAGPRTNRIVGRSGVLAPSPATRRAAARGRTACRRGCPAGRPRTRRRSRCTGCSRSSSRNDRRRSASGAQPFGRRRETTTGIGCVRVPASGPVGGALNAAGIGRSTGDPASTASYAGIDGHRSERRRGAIGGGSIGHGCRCAPPSPTPRPRRRAARRGPPRPGAWSRRRPRSGSRPRPPPRTPSPDRARRSRRGPTRRRRSPRSASGRAAAGRPTAGSRPIAAQTEDRDEVAPPRRRPAERPDRERVQADRRAAPTAMPIEDRARGEERVETAGPAAALGAAAHARAAATRRRWRPRRPSPRARAGAGRQRADRRVVALRIAARPPRAGPGRERPGGRSRRAPRGSRRSTRPGSDRAGTTSRASQQAEQPPPGR